MQLIKDFEQDSPKSKEMYPLSNFKSVPTRILLSGFSISSANNMIAKKKINIRTFFNTNLLFE